MRFQINKDMFILQSYDIDDFVIKFNIGIIINKVIIYEYVYYYEKENKIIFDNVEFLKKDREMIQNKIRDNIIQIALVIYRTNNFNITKKTKLAAP